MIVGQSAVPAAILGALVPLSWHLSLFPQSRGPTVRPKSGDSYSSDSALFDAAARSRQFRSLMISD
jgi:hypothetical protein